MQPEAVSLREPVVETDAGKVRGVTENGVTSFKGIPYAAPPVGELRWRAPQPVRPWKDVRPADRFGASCVQTPNPAHAFGVDGGDMSEDCLTLNVYRPASDKRLPVMVWIHGGGLQMGSATLPIYNGDEFARGDVVFVSINYRLGYLGYFAHPALTLENADGGRLGNYGLMDQIAALKWVRRNIAAFGGDPDNVTIFGQSAGALSVEALMISPEARGLFAKAIAQSGYTRGSYKRLAISAPKDRGHTVGGESSAEADGVRLAKSWGLGDHPSTAQLRSVPVDTIRDIAPNVIVNLILDGKTVAEDLWEAFRAGHEAPVPFLLGTNGLEVKDGQFPGGKSYIDSYLTADEQNHLFEFYNTKIGLGDLAESYFWSDVKQAEQARALARFHMNNGHPTYLYLFNVLPTGSPPNEGPRHSEEVPYVFNSFNHGETSTSDYSQKLRVSKIMNAQWRAFARSGNPSDSDLPGWPGYDGCRIMYYTLAGANPACDPRNTRLDELARYIDPRS